jgi:hypothetical protein
VESVWDEVIWMYGGDMTLEEVTGNRVRNF